MFKCRHVATRIRTQNGVNVKSTVKRESKTIELLKDVHLTDVERWRARGHAARAEAFADLVVAVAKGIASLAHSIERTSRLPARTAH